MILHVSAVNDAPGGNVQVTFKCLEAVPAPDKPAGAPAPKINPANPGALYPGFKVLSSFTIQLPAAEASTKFARGSRFELKSIG